MDRLQSFRVLLATGSLDNKVTVMLCGRSVGTSDSRPETGTRRRRTIRDTGRSAIYMTEISIDLAMEAMSVRPPTARDGEPRLKVS